MIAFFLLIALICGLSQVHSAPLDDYVWKADSNYGWVEMPEHNIVGEKLGFTGYMLNMTSQQWLTEADFSPSSQAKSIWWHYLVVIVPDEIKFANNGSLYITGWDQGSSPPTIHDEDISVAVALALSTGVVTGALFQVPNEHITFASDPIQKSRGEDAIIAFTWDHYMKDTSDPTWLVRFPMVKAGVRAMDAMSEFMAQKLPEKKAVPQYYAVAGASKRGWTTWLVGAVDAKRVMAIVPIVLDAIHFQAFAHHQFRSYGNWSWALSDYTDMQLMSRLDTTGMDMLAQMEDPFFFRDRLTMPKLVVNAVLDEFQQPDDTHYWWNDMPEPKHFIMTPNAEHSEATGILEIVPAIGAWIRQHLQQKVVPTFTWTINNSTGEIVATLDEHGIVEEANVQWAYSCGTNTDGKKRRDFRVASAENPCTCGVESQGMCANVKSLWHKQALQEVTVRGKRTFTVRLDAPTDGRYIAYFIDIKYKRGIPSDEVSFVSEKLGFIPKDLAGRLEFTTEVSVFPDTFPYPDCSGEACGNGLI